MRQVLRANEDLSASFEVDSNRCVREVNLIQRSLAGWALQRLRVQDRLLLSSLLYLLSSYRLLRKQMRSDSIQIEVVLQLFGSQPTCTDFLINNFDLFILFLNFFRSSTDSTFRTSISFVNLETLDRTAVAKWSPPGAQKSAFAALNKDPCLTY